MGLGVLEFGGFGFRATIRAIRAAVRAPYFAGSCFRKTFSQRFVTVVAGSLMNYRLKDQMTQVTPRNREHPFGSA